MAATAPFEVSLGDLFASLWRRRWTIVTFVILGVAVGLAVALLTIPTYTSETRIMLENRRNEVLDGSVLSGLTLSDETVETEIEVVASRDVRLRISKDLNLPAYLSDRVRAEERSSPLYRLHSSLADWLARRQEALGQIFARDTVELLIARPDTTDAVDFNGAMRYLSEAMQVRQAGNTSVIVVRATDMDADLAAAIANSAADVYLQRQLEWKASETTGANSYLEERIAALEAELTGKRAELQRLRNTIGQVGAGNENLLAQSRLLSNQRLLDARNERIRIETQLEQVANIVSNDDAASIAILVSTPLMQSLRADQSAARQVLAEFSAQYGERHPRIVDANNRLDEIDGNIRAEAERHVNALRTELRAARRQEALLQSELAAQSEAGQELDEDLSAAEALQSEIAATQELLDDYRTRFKDADDQRAVLRPDARIISDAVPNEFADFPNRKIILAGTVAVFGLLGLMMAVIRDTADRSLRSVGGAERALNVPVLGLIPALKGRFRRWLPVEYAALYPTTAFSESMRSIFTSLGLRPGKDRGQVLLVTSSLPGEGKSSTAATIAHQVARASLKAIIVECDMRKPSLARSLYGKQQPGLIQALKGDVTVAEAIQTDTHYGMDLIASGGRTENSLFMLQSDAMRQLLDKLAEDYDLILLDSPPVIALPDAQVLSEYANSILFLCRWGKTPRETAATGVRMLVRQGGAPVMAALTHVDMKRYASYDEAYGDPSIESYYG